MPLVSFIYLHWIGRQSSTHPQQKYLSHWFVHVSLDGSWYEVPNKRLLVIRIFLHYLIQWFTLWGISKYKLCTSTSVNNIIWSKAFVISETPFFLAIWRGPFPPLLSIQIIPVWSVKPWAPRRQPSGFIVVEVIVNAYFRWEGCFIIRNWSLTIWLSIHSFF